MLLKWMSCVPPAPRLLRALNMPTEQKAMRPTMMTWVHGELSACSLSVYFFKLHRRTLLTDIGSDHI